MPKGFGGNLMPGRTPKGPSAVQPQQRIIGSTNPGQDLVNKIRSGQSSIKLR